MSEWQAEFERLLTQRAGRAFGELRDFRDGSLRAGVSPEFLDGVVSSMRGASGAHLNTCSSLPWAKISCEKDHLSRNDAITKVFYK
jgi:hypothetical protein